jgi:hypothetical protein
MSEEFNVLYKVQSLKPLNEFPRPIDLRFEIT